MKSRQSIVAAAETLFLKKGYGGTTIEMIAEASGVVVQTLYNSIGNKAALLKEVFQATVSGPGEQRKVPEMMRERVSKAATAGEVIAILADWFVEVNARSARLWRVIDDAAAYDGEIARFRKLRSQQRLRNYREAAEAMARRGGARLLDAEEAAALIWSVAHPQVYTTLVVDAGWTVEAYRRWLTKALSSVGSSGSRSRSSGSRRRAS